jgi:hypothetical protein
MSELSDRDKIFYLFGGLPYEEKRNAPDGVKIEYSTWAKEPKLIKPPFMEAQGNWLNPNTYGELKNRYKNLEDIVLTPPAFNLRSNDSRGGSRRSLQKSRFLKRKSRKYKSIKKSKKRSFRNRGRH